MTSPRPVVLLVTVALLLTGTRPSTATELYETYYHYIGNYPDCAQTIYSEEAQGITNDGYAWYIASNNTEYDYGVVRRAPVDYDLSTPDYEAHVPDHSDSIAGHLGGLSYYAGANCLVVPVATSSSSLAVMGADSSMSVRATIALPDQAHVEWVAVNQDGIILTSEDGYINQLIAYTVDWTPVTPVITSTTHIPLLDSDGNPTYVDKIQGGAFSPSEGLLYMTSGDCEDLAESDPHRDEWGIHVFDTNTWRRVAKSNNGSGLFSYAFNPEWGVSQQPEGLTFWDLDDGLAPGVSGQLHAIVLENDYLTSDDVYIKHYTNVIHVDGEHSGDQDGTLSKPYNTVQAALTFYGDYDWWNGGRIRIKSGTYPETVTFGKRMQVLSRGGVATVGSFGKMRIDALGTVNVSTGGALKMH